MWAAVFSIGSRKPVQSVLTTTMTGTQVDHRRPSRTAATAINTSPATTPMVMTAWRAWLTGTSTGGVGMVGMRRAYGNPGGPVNVRVESYSGGHPRAPGLAPSVRRSQSLAFDVNVRIGGSGSIGHERDRRSPEGGPGRRR